MKQQVRTHLSTFCLLVLLIPSIAGNLHAHHHKNKGCQDISGEVVSAYEAVHHCLLCGYIPAQATEPAIIEYEEVILSCAFTSLPATDNLITDNQTCYYSLRAPPAIA